MLSLSLFMLMYAHHDDIIIMHVHHTAFRGNIPNLEEIEERILSQKIMRVKTVKIKTTTNGAKRSSGSVRTETMKRLVLTEHWKSDLEVRILHKGRLFPVTSEFLRPQVQFVTFGTGSAVQSRDNARGSTVFQQCQSVERTESDTLTTQERLDTF